MLNFAICMFNTSPFDFHTSRTQVPIIGVGFTRSLFHLPLFIEKPLQDNCLDSVIVNQNTVFDEASRY